VSLITLICLVFFRVFLLLDFFPLCLIARFEETFYLCPSTLGCLLSSCACPTASACIGSRRFVASVGSGGGDGGRV